MLWYKIFVLQNGEVWSVVVQMLILLKGFVLSKDAMRGGLPLAPTARAGGALTFFRYPLKKFGRLPFRLDLLPEGDVTMGRLRRRKQQLVGLSYSTKWRMEGR